MQKTNVSSIILMENVKKTTFYSKNQNLKNSSPAKPKSKYKYIFSVFALLFLTLTMSSCISTGSSARETRNLLDLIDYLDKHNLKAEQIIPIQYHILHASDGCALVIKGTRVEFYVYDTAIPQQKLELEKIKKNNSVKVLAYTIPVEINGGIIMLVYSKKNNIPQIIKTFKAFPANYKSSLK